MEFHFAPIQGHTDAAYRHFHSENYGNHQTYYTPFIRLEKIGIRNRDIKDLKSELNKNIKIIPQIIFRDEKELSSLIKLLNNSGEKNIDLNMGCPFPLQTGHGRGAASINNTELISILPEILSSYPDINFSVKMRLGFKDPDEWKLLIPYLNKIRLSHIAVHPRVAKQQYEGELFLDKFSDILLASENPVIFNGEIKSPSDYYNIRERFKGLSGIMIGRGLLSRPSIIQEIKEKNEWEPKERLSKLMYFHRQLFNHYEETLCGENQILMKIKPFWEFSENEIGRKPWKEIKKASNISKYKSAVASII